MERLHILGTGNAMATACYNTCFTIESQGGHILVDAGGGNGILSQLKKTGIGIDQIHSIFVSHCHIDHILGIIWVIRVFGASVASKSEEASLVIYGHSDVITTLNTMIDKLLNKKQAKSLEGKLQLVTVEDKESVTLLGTSLLFFDIGSSKDRQFGCQFSLPSGKKVTFLGDEPYGDHEQAYVEGTDYLMHEAFCLYEERDQFKPYEKHHATVKEASALAEQLKIPNLILYHTEDSDIKRRKERYGNEGRAYYTGNLLVPDDLEVIHL